jgi:hypothetical protein
VARSIFLYLLCFYSPLPPVPKYVWWLRIYEHLSTREWIYRLSVNSSTVLQINSLQTELRLFWIVIYCKVEIENAHRIWW